MLKVIYFLAEKEKCIYFCFGSLVVNFRQVFPKLIYLDTKCYIKQRKAQNWAMRSRSWRCSKKYVEPRPLWEKKPLIAGSSALIIIIVFVVCCYYSTRHYKEKEHTKQLQFCENKLHLMHLFSLEPVVCYYLNFFFVWQKRQENPVLRLRPHWLPSK